MADSNPQSGADNKSADNKGALPVAAKPRKLLLRAVHGELVHPYTRPEVRFSTENAKSHEVDGWVKIQMDAGKLVEATE